MASVDELSSQIEALKGEIEQTAESAGSSMSSAEELSNQTQALGMESKAAEAMAVKDSLEQLQQGLQAIGQQAEGVRAQVEAMRTLQGGTGGGVSAGGGQEATPTPAGGSGGSQGPTDPPTGGPPAAAGDDAEPSESEGGNGGSPDGPYQYRVGEPLEPLPELDLDEDRGSKVGQVGRSMYKNMGDYQAAAKDYGQTAQSLLTDGYQPFRGGQAQTETAKDTGFNNPPVGLDNQTHLEAGDVIGNALFGLASFMHGVGWAIDWRRRRRNDGAD